jgi:phosphoglycolate phosphatase
MKSASRPPSFDAILFDLDGTLANTIADIAASINHIREEWGHPAWTTAQVQECVGDGIHKLLERTLETLDPSAIQRALVIQRAYYEEHCLDHTVLYPGILAVLEALRERQLPLGVVSNKLASSSEKVLKGLKIRDFFATVVGGDSTPHRKPDPRPLQVAAEQMKIHSRRILVVGDSSNDILSARRAGFTSCAVTWGFRSEESIVAAHPDHLVRSPSEILEVV